MPLDYVVVAVAAVGAAITAAPALFGHWRNPGLRRWTLATSALTFGLGVAAVLGWLGSGLSTTLAYALLVTCVALTAVGMLLVARDERTPVGSPVAAGAEPPAGAEVPEPTEPEPGEPDLGDLSEPDLSEEALLFTTTTRHGWGPELAALLAADADDEPAAPPRRGA